MDPRFYSIIHVFFILLLTGSIFYIVANPQPHKKRKMMILSGIASLLALVGAAGVLGKNFGALPAGGWTQGWVIVKLIAWLLLTGLAGMAYRISKTAVIWSTVALTLIALYMVYFRPF